MAGETPDRGAVRVVAGRYRLLRTLGAGGMGRVWLAYDEELACEVAMKEIALPDLAMDRAEPVTGRIARARSEARHAARLRGHPHVATVHDVVVHEGLPWIVMEHVPDAVDLQAVVRRSGPVPPAQAARIGLAVLDALTAGHRIGILHRDVKPANILLSPDASGDTYARVLLTDYGIALQPESLEPRLTATAGILGTPGYLAPERARGEPPTPAADLFSLGATLYAAVEGRGPFDRHGDYATLTALLGEEPTPPARAGELAPVIRGLLVKDPMRRSSPEAVARGLERVLRSAEGTEGAAAGWAARAAADGSGVPRGGPDTPPVGFGPPPAGYGTAGAGAEARPGGDGVSPGAGLPPGPGAAAPGQGAAAYGARTPSGAGAPGAAQPPGTPPAQYTPGTPQASYTPGAPHTPQTPRTPHTPAGPHDFPVVGGLGPGAAAGRAGSEAGSAPPGGPAGPGGAGGPGGVVPAGGFAPPSAPDTPGHPPRPEGPGTPPGPGPGFAPYGSWPPPVPQQSFDVVDAVDPYAQTSEGSHARAAPADPHAQASGNPFAASGGNPSPYGGAATPYGGNPVPRSGDPTPYGGNAGGFGGSSPPYGGGSGGYGGGSTPYGGEPTAYGSGGSRPPSGGRRRLAVVALVVAAVLVVAGGTWAVVLLAGDKGDGGDTTAARRSSASSGPQSPSPTGPVYPYGSVVGLTEPLETGDCVKAVWSGTPFGSAPNLGVVDCVDDWPDGQVVAVDTATDFADARAQGATRCAAQSKAVVDALPDAGGYAVVPTRDGFDAADSGTACLVLGRHAAIGGEVGRFRDAGTDLWVGQMSVGDCWIYKELDNGYESPLTDCAKPHTDQVIGTVQAPDEMSYKKGRDNATKLCGNKFESVWAPGSERLVVGWMTDEDDWNAGFTTIVCTVSRADNGKTTGKIPAPGSV